MGNRNNRLYIAGMFCLILVSVALGVWRWLAASPLAANLPPEIKANTLPYQARLIKTIAEESTEESISKLPSYDDVGWSDGPGSDVPLWDSYQWQATTIPSLVRVRKVLKAGREEPRTVVPQLRATFTNALEGFLVARQEDEAALNKAIAQGKGGLTKAAPTECDRKMIYSQASAFLLAQLNESNSLPDMVKAYRLPQQLPVNRIFLFYSIHLLAQIHPRSHLREDALRLDRYLDATKGVPAGKRVSVAAWNAQLTEADFRASILHQDIGLEKQPHFEVIVYPNDLAKYEEYFSDKIDPQIDAWFKPLGEFVDVAYPR